MEPVSELVDICFCCLTNSLSVEGDSEMSTRSSGLSKDPFLRVVGEDLAGEGVGLRSLDGVHTKDDSYPDSVNLIGKSKLTLDLLRCLLPE